jgi:hypothetical protein
LTQNSNKRRANDPARQAKIEAALRHAEHIAKHTRATGAVLFRPDPPTQKIAPKSDLRSRKVPAANPPRRNPAMETTLREALKIPQKPAAPVSSQATTPKKKSGEHIKATRDATSTSPNQKARRRSKSPSTAAKPAKAAKPKAVPKAAKSSNVMVRRSAEPKIDRKLAAERTAASRRAFNASRRKAAAQASVASSSPFIELQQKWQAAFSYLQRFEESNPDALDVLAAIERLKEVEAEWDRRHNLAVDHPDYFRWPSTEASLGEGSVTTGEWQEIGMLRYLGYQVGRTSELTAAQRTRLLGHIFGMRLPPMNGVAYMRSWASPRSGPRLRKMAEGLAAFARNAKRRRNPNLAEAIRQWEDDLSYLRRTFYVGHFDFPWPTP